MYALDGTEASEADWLDSTGLEKEEGSMEGVNSSRCHRDGEVGREGGGIGTAVFSFLSFFLYFDIPFHLFLSLFTSILLLLLG